MIVLVPFSPRGWQPFVSLRYALVFANKTASQPTHRIARRPLGGWGGDHPIPLLPLSRHSRHPNGNTWHHSKGSTFPSRGLFFFFGVAITHATGQTFMRDNRPRGSSISTSQSSHQSPSPLRNPTVCACRALFTTFPPDVLAAIITRRVAGLGLHPPPRRVAGRRLPGAFAGAALVLLPYAAFLLRRSAPWRMAPRPLPPAPEGWLNLWGSPGEGGRGLGLLERRVYAKGGGHSVAGILHSYWSSFFSVLFEILL